MLFIFIVNFMQSQNLYLYSGKNITKYNFETSNGEKSPNLVIGSGNYYELGYEMPLKIKNFFYRGGFSFNQFNSTGGNELSQVAWKTNYLGIQNSIDYAFLNTDYGLKIIGNIGLNIATIIQGDQIVNNVHYNLCKQEEFKGLFLQPSVGLDIRYNVSNVFDISLKYSLSKALNLTSTTDQKLTFTNNQIAFGLIFPINKNKVE